MSEIVQNTNVVNAIKLSSVSHHFKNTDETVLQKDIHAKFVKKDYSRQSDADKHMKTHALIRETFTCHWCGCQCLTGKQLQLYIEQAHADLL